MLNFILSARLLCAEKPCKNLAYFTLLNIVHKGKVGDHEKLVGECTLGSILRDRIAEISLSFRKTSRITHFLSSLYKNILELSYEDHYFQFLMVNLVSGEGPGPLVINVEFHPLLIQRQQGWP